MAYIPNHAHGNWQHHDVEHGRVSSVSGNLVNVKFDKQVNNRGWDGTTARPIYSRDLKLLHPGTNS